MDDKGVSQKHSMSMKYNAELTNEPLRVLAFFAHQSDPNKTAMHAKAPVMLSLSLPGCAESPHAYALVKAEVARHLIQMITSLQQTHAN